MECEGPLQRNLKLTIEYDGTRYFGWQFQVGRPTIQGVLEGVLARILDHPVRVTAAGRTDRGVHALGQVAACLTSSRIPADRLVLAANSYLPEDIVLRDAEEVPPTFHARRSATGKWYRYTILNRRIPQVRCRHFHAQVAWPLDVERMGEAARAFVGEHDFRAFQSNSKRPPAPTVRMVFCVDVAREGDFISIDVVGRSFLYTMVRTIAGTLIEVGRGKRAPGEVTELLGRRDRRLSGPTADPRGLCLMEVYYGPIPALRRGDPAAGGS